MYKVIFEADTPAGKLFDVALLILIFLSVFIICLETVPGFHQYQRTFYLAEWVVTILFTIEYSCRILCVRRPVDIFSAFLESSTCCRFCPPISPPWPVARVASFAVLRAIRLLRVFRVLKLVWLIAEANEMGRSVWAARGKIIVFLMVVVVAVTIAGAVMYELEGPGTVGRRSPHCAVDSHGNLLGHRHHDHGRLRRLRAANRTGKAFSALLILLGYSLIIVPTGFVSAEFMKGKAKRLVTTRLCDNCMTEGHDPDARYCKYCAHELLK